jgi:hypothetical protein
VSVAQNEQNRCYAEGDNKCAELRVMLQVEADHYILDYNPTVITGLQAFCIALTNFDCKLLL